MLFLLSALATVTEVTAAVTGAAVASTGAIGTAIAAGTAGIGSAIGSAAAVTATAAGMESAAGVLGTLATGGTTTALNVGVIEAGKALAED